MVSPESGEAAAQVEEYTPLMGLENVRGIDGQIIELHKQRVAEMDRLAEVVWANTLDIVRGIFDGEDFPEDVAKHSYLARYGRDDKYSYAGDNDSPFKDGDFNMYNVMNKNGVRLSHVDPYLSLARLEFDLDLLVLRELGGVDNLVPESIFYQVLARAPFNFHNIDATLNPENFRTKIDTDSIRHEYVQEWGELGFTFHDEHIQNRGRYY